MTFSQTVTLLADSMTVIISAIAIWGIVVAHRRGIFRGLREIGLGARGRDKK